MANISTYYATRDYTMPAIDRRISDLLKRRIGAKEGLPTESMKERLAKYKENRTARQALLKTTHQHVLEMVAYILNTDPGLLEEGILDKDEYVNTFSSFFVEGGRQAIVIYYQMMPPPPLESGRWSAALAKEPQVLRCCVTDGSTDKFCGKCVIVYRCRSNVDFEMKQLLEVRIQTQKLLNTFTANGPTVGSSYSAKIRVWPFDGVEK
ncbi:uncharacterized protein LOC124416248 [Diprion similis]|uniref:uncharacterized protein LOC124416248 n=1 Tax=Diprion similis TaxID=362088 RepID=UPI001EF90804|nr:uncharacterized protein LOC124416248 [Diprion similis]